MNAPRSPSVADISRALGLPTTPAEWRPTGVVLDALVELKVRCDGDRLTTAWRLATFWSRKWSWESTYHEAAARGLSAEEVRKRWPRFYGLCPDCNTEVIHYASTAHYVLGDW
jgi:hypothetical protein